MCGSIPCPGEDRPEHPPGLVGQLSTAPGDQPLAVENGVRSLAVRPPRQRNRRHANEKPSLAFRQLQPSLQNKSDFLRVCHSGDAAFQHSTDGEGMDRSLQREATQEQHSTAILSDTGVPVDGYGLANA